MGDGLVGKTASQATCGFSISDTIAHLANLVKSRRNTPGTGIGAGIGV